MENFFKHWFTSSHIFSLDSVLPITRFPMWTSASRIQPVWLLKFFLVFEVLRSEKCPTWERLLYTDFQIICNQAYLELLSYYWIRPFSFSFSIYFLEWDRMNFQGHYTCCNTQKDSSGFSKMWFLKRANSKLFIKVSMFKFHSA